MQAQTLSSVRSSSTQIGNHVKEKPLSTSQISKSSQFNGINTPTNKSIINLIPGMLAKLLGIQDAQAAYLAEGEAGHGNLNLGKNVRLQGYVSDLPMNYDIAANREQDQQLERRCKHINVGTNKEAKVCVGLNNNLPEEGDHDFILLDDKWYKLRTGTAHISRNKDGTHDVEPAGLDIAPGQVSIYRPGSAFSEPKKVPTVMHRVDDPDSVGAELAYVLNNKPKREPVDYLHRLHNEDGLGPLPVIPPTWEQIMEDEASKTQEHHERSNEKYNENRSIIMP